LAARKNNGLIYVGPGYGLNPDYPFFFLSPVIYHASCRIMPPKRNNRAHVDAEFCFRPAAQSSPRPRKPRRFAAGILFPGDEGLGRFIGVTPFTPLPTPSCEVPSGWRRIRPVPKYLSHQRARPRKPASTSLGPEGQPNWWAVRTTQTAVFFPSDPWPGISWCSVWPAVSHTPGLIAARIFRRASPANTAARSLLLGLPFKSRTR